MKTGGSAFPIKGPLMTSDELGMTLRDYFAAKAMAMCPPLFSIVDKAEFAYRMADAMLRERDK